MLQLSETFYSALLLALPSDHKMAALRRRSDSAFPRTQTTSGTLAPTCNSSPAPESASFPYCHQGDNAEREDGPSDRSEHASEAS